MDTAQRKLLFQVQFWGLIGPLVALVTMLVIFVKSPPQAIYLSMATILGLLCSLQWKIKGFAVSLGFVILLYLYQFSEINPDEHLWHIGMNLSIAIGFIITALAYMEVELLLHPLKAHTKTGFVEDNSSLQEQADTMAQDLLIKTKELKSYETLVENVKGEVIKINDRHEKLVEDFLEKQHALSYTQEKLVFAEEEIKKISEQIIAHEDIKEQLRQKTREVLKFQEELKEMANRLENARKERPQADDENIQELKSTNELLSRERGRLETMLFRTQIDLHQKTQDLIHLPELQAELENLKEENRNLQIALANVEIADPSSDELEIVNKNLQEELESSVKKMEALRLTVSELENYLESEQASNKALESSLISLKETVTAKLAIYEKEIQGIEDRLAKEAKEKQALEVSYDELKNLNAKSQEQFLAKVIEIENLQSSCATLKDERAKNADELLEKSNQLKALTSKLAENENLRSAYAILKDEIAKKAEELSEKSNQLESSQAKNAEAEISLKSLEQQILEKADRVKALEIKNKEIENRSEKVKSENEELKNLSAKVQEEIEKIRLEASENLVESPDAIELLFNLRKIEGKYNQLREQFELKSEVLNETRKELFKTENQVLQLKLELDEIEVYNINESEAVIQQHLLKTYNESDEKIKELQAEVDILQGIVTALIHE